MVVSAPAPDVGSGGLPHGRREKVVAGLEEMSDVLFPTVVPAATDGLRRSGDGSLARGGGAKRAQAEHRVHHVRRTRLLRVGLHGTPAFHHPEHRPPGGVRDPLHAGAGRLVGLCADAVLPHDGQARGAHVGPQERRRHAAAGRGGNRRIGAEARRLRHRRLRQVGLRRTRIDRRPREARVRHLRRLLRPGPRPQLLSALHRPQQRGDAARGEPRGLGRPDILALRHHGGGPQVHPGQPGPAVLLLPAGHPAARHPRHPGRGPRVGAVQGQAVASPPAAMPPWSTWSTARWARF